MHILFYYFSFNEFNVICGFFFFLDKNDFNWKQFDERLNCAEKLIYHQKTKYTITVFSKSFPTILFHSSFNLICNMNKNKEVMIFFTSKFSHKGISIWSLGMIASFTRIGTKKTKTDRETFRLWPRDPMLTVRIVPHYLCWWSLRSVWSRHL